MRRVVLFLIISAIICPCYVAMAQDEPISPSIIGTGVYHGLTPPLKDIPAITEAEWAELIAKGEKKVLNKKLENRSYPFESIALPKGQDEAWQKQMGQTENTKAPILNFSGQTSPYFPSDCNGTVGPNHFMQTINTVYAIYNNTTGALVAGPSNMNALFSGVTGATCNDGDPLVLYDEQADRWLAVEFSICGANDYMLVAVSQTSDPTGSWHKYSFDVADMPDYEKFGIWQDGYYMGTNNSSGNDIYVFQRSQMLNGLTAQFVGFNNAWRPTTIDGFMCVPPLDNDGAFAPAGSPGLFITINDDAIGGGSDQLWIYELAVNWATPASSTFNRVQQLGVTAFDSNFGATWDNIKQPIAQELDGIPQVIMNIPQYRNFGTYQTIVCCHTVDVDATDHAGIRWYELRKTTGSWSVRQTGTYAPDVHSRWMGSVALNGFSEIGLGYSISSTTVYPGIRYCGQSASAYATGAGVMDIAESVIQTATSAQSSYNRWGDYSAISIDPDDDHTFWFTTQYGGSRQTKIANWQFTAPALTANFSGTPTSVCTGSSVTFTDLSVGGPTSWSWSFPGGTPASHSGQTPPAIYYNTAGTYDVTLTVTNATSNDSEIKTGYITVSGIIANFSGTPTTVNVGGTVTFSDLSSCSPTSWSWSFPGGSPSTYSGQTPPAIAYNTVGTYNVSLVATNASGSDTETKTAYINVINCTYCASSGTTFSEEWISNVTFNTINNTTTGTAGYNDYTSISTTVTKSTAYTASMSCGSTGSWAENYWIFIDWNQDCDFTDTGESFDLGTTTGPGTRTLSITIPATATTGATRMRTSLKYNADPTSCETFSYGEVEDYTLVIQGAGSAPVANFTANNLTPFIGQTVTFTDLSTNTPTSWNWSFSPATVTYAGGTSSASQNPQVQFNAGGQYTATLTATNAYGSDPETKTNYISVQYAPVADFSANNTTPNVGQTVIFTDLSTNTPTSWSWTFNPATVTYTGGTSSASQNPQVQFNAQGLYTVSLTAANASGPNTMTKTNYINVQGIPPVATIQLGTVTNPAPGTVLVPVTLEAINNPMTGNNLISSWSWYIAYDATRLYNAAPMTPANLTNYNAQFPTANYLTNIIENNPAPGWNTIAVIYSAAVSGTGSVGMKFFDIVFTYTPGITVCPNLFWTSTPGDAKGISSTDFVTNMADDEGNEFVLTLINGCVWSEPPVTDFVASTTTPFVGATVNFTDLSTNYPTSWLWAFTPSTVTYTGGTTSASQNPQVQFNDAGNYTVQLTSVNAIGNDTEIKTDYIVVSATDLNLELTMLLEGPFDGVQMTPLLNGILPLSQPYNSAPWNYAGTESVAAIPNPNVVDWILIELRDAVDAVSATGTTAIARQAAFVQSDGAVIGIDGMPGLHFTTTVSNNLFVVVYHHNHLSIMSSVGLTKSGGVYTYNFSTGSGQVYGGTDGHKELPMGYWGMTGGDGDHDGVIGTTDYSPAWETEAGTSGYLESDYNLDMQSDNIDKDEIWLPNSGKGTQVPN
jgi:PKD repeat protein